MRAIARRDGSGAAAPSDILFTRRAGVAPAADLHLRRRDAEGLCNAEALRVREDRRRLRLQVRVLHHPDPARPLPQPRPPNRSSRRHGRLAARGTKEILLISQDTTFYGIDRDERGALPRLLRALNRWTAWSGFACCTSTRRRSTMRRSTRWLSGESLQLHRLAAAARVRPGPKRMKRPGTRGDYDALLGRIRARVPGVALRTTFIVGFPGETEADVDQLCEFVGDHPFDHVGVFTYSHEEGTSAHTLEDDVPAAMKRERRNRVMSAAKAAGRQAAKSPGWRADTAAGGRSGLRTTSSSLKAGWPRRRPTSTPGVLTDCDPPPMARAISSMSNRWSEGLRPDWAAGRHAIISGFGA